MLTEPTLEGGDGPRVSQLIMVGTPNHGSELARFRSLAEWRDQFSDLLEGDFHWLGFIFDGAGEAGIDLLPGSRFLRELNARPGPRSTRLTVIAAELSKYDRERVSGLVEEESALVEAQALLAEVSASVGDGLVSVASARLDGADFHLVEGNHMSMIRNVLESSQRVPPAVPLVVRLLQNPDQTVTSIP
jgi:hypothetical protein